MLSGSDKNPTEIINFFCFHEDVIGIGFYRCGGYRFNSRQNLNFGRSPEFCTRWDIDSFSVTRGNDIGTTFDADCAVH